MSKQIRLLNSYKTTTVDDEDYEWLNAYRWFLNKDGYVERYETIKRGKRTVRRGILMHEQIMGIERYHYD